MTDGGQDFNLGHVVGADGEKGDNGSTVWNTSTAPTYANSKYTFTISNLSGKTGLEIAVNDIIFYSTYYYIVSAVGSTTVDCNTRVNIKGSDASVTIVDNLTSTSSTSALSAKQGKVLNDNKVETSAIATSWGGTTSDSKVPSEKLAKTSLDAKQATLVSGTNIKTINNNSILGSGNLEIQSSSVDIATSWGSTLSDTKVPSEKLTKNSLDAKADASSLATVATTGDYDDLTDKPSIPSKISDLQNDSDFIVTSSVIGLIKNDGTVDETSYLPASSYVPYYYATCSTDASTQDKALTITGFTLATGVVVVVKFSNGNSYNGTARLKINSGTAIDIATVGTTKTSRYHWTAGEVITFVYDGTNFVMDSEGTATTTYYGVTKLSDSTSSTSTSLAATANAVKTAYDLAASKASVSDIPTDLSDLTDSTNLIPSKISDLTNDSDFIETSSTEGVIANDGSIIGIGTTQGTVAAGNHTHSNYISGTKVTSWSGSVSDSNIPSEKLVKNTLDDKISKSSTAGLIKNDGSIDTTSYSTFSGSYNDLSNKPTIPSASSTTPSADTSSGSYGSGTSYARSNHSHPKSSLYAESSHTHTKSQITDFPSLSTVATSGSYADLSNKPSIPSSSSDLSDGSDLVKKSSTTGLLKNDGSVMTGGTGSSNYAIGNHTHSGYVSATKVTSWQSTPSDSNVPSEKLVKDYVDGLIGSAISYIVGSGS